MEQAKGHGRGVRGVVSTLAGACCWGFSGTCVQYLFASTDMGSVTLTTIRQLGAGLIFLAVLLARDRAGYLDMLTTPGVGWRLLVFGALGLFLNSTLYATTIAYTNAGTATVLQSLSIVVTLVLTCLATRRLPGRLETAALVCALAATLLIATHGDPTTLSLPWQGLAFGAACACSAAFYTMFPRPLFERFDSLAVTGTGMLVGGLTGLVATLASGELAGGLPAVDATGWLVLAVAIVIGTFGAYGLFLHGVSIVGAVAGNMLGAAEPVSATVMSALVLATPFVWADWAGLALMVATILLIALEGRDV